ncbi:MAG: hypothetical protein PHG89_02800 [Gallionella sp.]|nr:hypothetical protein [Gallionella sp.]
MAEVIQNIDVDGADPTKVIYVQDAPIIPFGSLGTSEMMELCLRVP